LTSSSGFSAGAAALATGADWPGLATHNARPIDSEDTQISRCIKPPRRIVAEG
jgi:hypothetical protein